MGGLARMVCACLFGSLGLKAFGGFAATSKPHKYLAISSDLLLYLKVF